MLDRSRSAESALRKSSLSQEFVIGNKRAANLFRAVFPISQNPHVIGNRNRRNSIAHCSIFASEVWSVATFPRYKIYRTENPWREKFFRIEIYSAKAPSLFISMKIAKPEFRKGTRDFLDRFLPFLFINSYRHIISLA